MTEEYAETPTRLDIEAVLAQIEAGVASRETVFQALSDLLDAGDAIPLLLEKCALEFYVADDPSRVDLKRRLYAVTRKLNQDPPASLADELRRGFVEEEYEIDFQSLLDGYAKQVRFRDLEPAFFPVLDEVRRYSMTSVERLYALWTSVRYLLRAGIPGDFVEAGVWRGGSVMLMAREILRLGHEPRRLWLYDTFSGLPRPNPDLDVDILGNRGIDGWEARNVSGGFSHWAYADEAEVRRNMTTTGYPEAMQRFVVGRVEETLPDQAPASIALLRVDTDWYDSYRHVLETLYDRVVPGGVLIFDDYGHFKGARKAIDDFWSRRGIALPLVRIDYSCRLVIKGQ